jgi:hypothetical protein
MARLVLPDAQRVALLAEQGVAAVPGAVRPDLAVLGEVRDVLGGVAGPRHVGLALGERGADAVHGLDEEAVLAELLQHLLAHTGHRAHGGGDVRGVGDLDADGGELRAQRAHAEGDDVHRAAPHGAAEQALVTGEAPVTREDGTHLVGVLPVVGRARVLLLLGADEGTVLDASDVGRVGGGVVRVGALDRIELLERALLDEFVSEALVLVLRAVAPHDLVRLGQLGYLADPCDQVLVIGGSRFDARHDRSDPPGVHSPGVCCLRVLSCCCRPLGGCDPDAASWDAHPVPSALI